jgi:uncharacterized protein (DUF2147 family)
MALTAPATAAPPSPVGEWLVANGHARIKIDQCGKNVWGVISWEGKPGGVDSNNPDPAKRNRPMLGMPILLDLKAGDEGRWEGQVYNAENGKVYDASIRLKSPEVLEIQGCVLGFLCGGEDWTRFHAPAEAAPAPAPRNSKPAGRSAAANPADGKAADGSVNVCQSVAAATGVPIETLVPQAHPQPPAHKKR